MTSEEQRIAIAQACPHLMMRATDGKWLFKLNGYFVECDPLADLNAMHEAEKALQDRSKYWPDYIDELAKLFPLTGGGVNWSQMVHATAAQRAEAFLKAFKLWRD